MPTPTDQLAAARTRVQQRQTELEQARTALALIEHDAYADALQAISDAIGALPASATSDQLEALIGSIEARVSGLGFPQ